MFPIRRYSGFKRNPSLLASRRATSVGRVSRRSWGGTGNRAQRKSSGSTDQVTSEPTWSCQSFMKSPQTPLLSYDNVNRMATFAEDATLNAYTYDSDGFKKVENVGGSLSTIIWDGTDYLLVHG